MKLPFPFEPVLVFGTLAILLLIGVLLRAKVGFFQRFLIPSCLIGGLVGVIALNAGAIPFGHSVFETFAYHLFIISFISVGLTRPIKRAPGEGVQGKGVKGPVWMALVEGVTISLQAIIGCLFVMLFAALGMELFPTFGLFAPLGFTEGPGQALSFGKVWEGFGFSHAATIGLTFATLGFFFAFFVGVPLVNWGIKRGLSVSGPVRLSRETLVGVIGRDQAKEPAGELTMHSGNIDTLAFQMALVGMVYVITYGFVVALGRIVPPDVAKTLWGFFFFFGMAFALLMRAIMGKLGLDYLIDPGIQRRITGWSVDFLIVATVTAIQAAIVVDYLVPIMAMGLASGIVTTWVVFFLGRRIDKLNLERTVSIFGTCTGTVPSGLLLLRIADPDFQTPVALELGLMNVFAVPLILGSMILINAPIWWNWHIGLVALAHLGLLVISVVLIKSFGMWGPRKF